MLGRVRGFDSRYWDGRLPDNHGMKFVYIKSTQDDRFLAENFWTNWVAAEEERLKRGQYHFWKYWPDQTLQAVHFADHAASSGYGELPLVLDFEDVQAPKDKTTFERMAAFYHALMKELGPAQQDVIVYTGNWWWETWVDPFLKKATWNPYLLRLWGHPRKNTKNPGEWTEMVIQQTELDVHYPGFKAAIDVDWMDQALWDELFPIPEDHPPGPCPEYRRRWSPRPPLVPRPQRLPCPPER